MSVFEVKGTRKLIGALNDRASLKDVKRVVKQNGTELQSLTKSNTPVDTGDLKRSISYNALDEGLTAKVKAHMFYAGYVEWGTRYMLPRLYSKRSFYSQRRIFISDMKRLMK